ncbi:MAG: hypothetical protein IJ341_12705 [Bacteroidales bacterium]|nr:hypothetical protein [Bacteroidales bacterium]
MNTIFVKILDDGRIIEAPKNYKNISNFNKFPSLMRKEGFIERIKGWKKSDGTLKYIEPEKWGQHKTYYTTFPYQGADYEWSDEKNSWEIKLEVAKQQKLEEVRQATNSYMEQLKSNFSNAEMETWTRQEHGVKLLTENPESEEYDAQWVKALAQTRGITLEEQMQRISYATTMMNTMAYQLVGYQQRLEDMINAATTIDEIYNIVFEIE